MTGERREKQERGKREDNDKIEEREKMIMTTRNETGTKAMMREERGGKDHDKRGNRKYQ